MSGPNWKLDDDYKTVIVTFPTSPPVALKLDVAGVEDILKNLGMFRGAMKPEVSKTHAMGQKVFAVPDPIWVAEPDALVGDSLLHIRDPHYGWLHYLLPKAEALKLGQILQAQAEVQHPSPGPGKAN